jgi:hypothetical protein
MWRAEVTDRAADAARHACARVASELHETPRGRSTHAAQADAGPWKQTTLLELVWSFCERMDDDAAVVAAVTDLVRRGRIRSEDGRWFELEVTP